MNQESKMIITQKNCITCGNTLIFSPLDCGLKCKGCGNVYALDYEPFNSKHPIENNADQNNWKDSKREYNCANCGSLVTLTNYEAAKKCSYCASTILVPGASLPGLKPEGIVPFKIPFEDAKNAFKKSISKKMFLPNKFKKVTPDDIHAVYISGFSFNYDFSASYHGIREVTEYVKTSEGTDIKHHRFPFSGNIDERFEDVLVESSDRIKQSDIDGILPYNMDEVVKYNDDFIYGYEYNYYNMPVKKAASVAKDEIYNDVRSYICSSQEGSVVSLTINPTYSNEEYNYILLPVYFVKYNYNNKEYCNIMNGQTGKANGKVPRSGVKITFFVLSILLVILAIVLLVLVTK